MVRTGIANLPLHYGRCPAWLFKRMKKLGGVISEVIINEYGQEEYLRRLSNPHFFQALGCVLGFDFHSSGLTVTVCGALKESLNKENLGIKVAGGKGKTSRKTPNELENSNLTTKKIEKLKYASKIAAKVDNSVLQDGYHLYHHSFIFTEKGKWAVIQQGMNPEDQYARRYHWLSDSVKDFVEEPHQAICGDKKNKTLDLTAKQSRETRKTSLDLVKSNPKHLPKYFKVKGQVSLNHFSQKEKVLHLKAKHWIQKMDLTKQDMLVLKRAYELQPRNYEELISLKGIGPKRIRALALVSDLVYGSQASWKDPVKYSFAHGGKDSTPRPVDKPVYDHSIQTLKQALENARIGNKEKLGAIKRLQSYINK